MNGTRIHNTSNIKKNNNNNIILGFKNLSLIKQGLWSRNVLQTFPSVLIYVYLNDYPANNYSTRDYVEILRRLDNVGIFTRGEGKEGFLSGEWSEVPEMRKTAV